MVQNTARKNSGALVPQRAGGQDGLGWWVEQYLQHAVTTSPASQRVQRRDLGRFLRYVQSEEGTDQRLAWTPRLARAFQQHLRQTLTPEGRRTWSDKTIQRILAHLKTFATWVHTHQPFPLGHPMAAIKLPTLGTGLEVDRALTGAERRRLLDAADLLLTIGGRSRDRKRYRTGERPRRTGYRPYRNRAIVYTLIGRCFTCVGPSQMARPNSYRLMKSPITKSCMRSVLEKHNVRRTNRLIRVRRLMCLLSIFCVFSLPT